MDGFLAVSKFAGDVVDKLDERAAFLECETRVAYEDIVLGCLVVAWRISLLIFKHCMQQL